MPTRHGRGWSIATWNSDVPTEATAAHKSTDGHGKDLEKSVSRKSWLPWKKDRDEVVDEEGKDEKKAAKEEMAHLDPDNDTTDPTPFAEKPSRLAMLVDPKSLSDLEKIGGINGLMQGLGVDKQKGMLVGADEAQTAEGGAPRSSTDVERRSGKQWSASMEQRRGVYGKNDLPIRPSKSLLYLMWLAFKDKVLVSIRSFFNASRLYQILLTVAAIVSLALGLYQDLGAPTRYTYDDEDCVNGCAEPKVDWVEGVAICVAIAIVILVGSVNDWQKERQFKKLNEKREDRTVKVMRSGTEMVINVKDVVVGDIALLEPGEILPVDGVFLRGHNVRCDESGATGESDAIKKFTYDECIEERDSVEPGGRLKRDCFMISGAKVLEGVGEYVVISVGKNSFNGRILMCE